MCRCEVVLPATVEAAVTVCGATVMLALFNVNIAWLGCHTIRYCKAASVGAISIKMKMTHSLQRGHLIATPPTRPPRNSIKYIKIDALLTFHAPCRSCRDFKRS